MTICKIQLYFQYSKSKTPSIIYYITGHDTAISIRPTID